MTRAGKFRGLASLAALHLSESELQLIHSSIRNMSTVSFIELIRDIEDELDNSLALTMSRLEERSSSNYGADELYRNLDQLRRHELGIPIQRFADLLTESLLQLDVVAPQQLPRFDGRRGFQAWVNKLILAIPEQEIFHAAARVVRERSNKNKSDWQLR